MVDPVLFDATAKAPKCWGHRVCPPQETLARLRPHLASMGITRLADITGLDRIGIPVVQAVRPMGRSLSVAQGKGIDLAAATASAAMEAAEGWHAEYIELPAKRGSLQSVMTGYPIKALPRLGELGVTKEISFLPGRCVATGSNCWLPSDLVHKDYTRPPELEMFFRSTSGLASGNTLAEAVASALHELIERDAMAAFDTMDEHERRQRRVNPEALMTMDRGLEDVIGRIESSGFSLFLHDVTSDIGVPVLMAQLGEIDVNLSRNGRPLSGLHVGSGCHLDPVTAAVRAITEAAQSRLTQIAGSRDDLADLCYLPAAHGNVLAILECAADRVAFGDRPFDCADASTESAGEDIAVLLSRLETTGIDRVSWIDLSRKGLPVHVVRVVAAGLGILTRDGARPGHRSRAKRAA